MPGGQQQSQTGDTDTTRDPMQQPQTDWRTIADATASIPNALYVYRADRTYPGGASDSPSLCSFIRSHKSCIAAGIAVLLSLFAASLAPQTFINKEEISQLTDTVNDLKSNLETMSQRDVDKERNQPTAKESLLGMSKMTASLSLQSVLDQLQREMQQLHAQNQEMKKEMQQLQNETATKDHIYQAEIQQLQNEMGAKDQKIQDLEQRDYVERCESGELETPHEVFTSGAGARYLDLTAEFSRAFRTTPVVTVGLTKLDHLDGDGGGDGNIRVTASVESVSTTSLKVRVGTWNSSQLYYAKIRWMACA